jgi:hypothetical protein
MGVFRNYNDSLAQFRGQNNDTMKDEHPLIRSTAVEISPPFAFTTLPV